MVKRRRSSDGGGYMSVGVGGDTGGVKIARGVAV